MPKPNDLDGWRCYLYNLIAAEISTTSRYYDHLIHFSPLAHDNGYLAGSINCPEQSVVQGPDDLPTWVADPERSTMLLLNGNLNYCSNIQELLESLRPKLCRTSRLIAVTYNPYLSWLYRLANRLGIRSAPLPDNFLTSTSLDSIARLSGYRVERVRLSGYLPARLFGLGTLVNRIMPAMPLAKWLSFACILTLRPVIEERGNPSLSIVVPARNERENIESLLQRIPHLEGARVEVVFVEGHSNDGTWEEIQRLLPLYQDRFRLSAVRQPGRGKNDAVRLGLAESTGDLVTILDADLTMPPECLDLYYRSYCSGLGDFVNGNRLVYRMETGAMKPLNRLGNIFFAKLLSFLLGVKLGDSLCGTKMFSRRNYRRMAEWCKDFGDFDPFGDFELLFSASELALGIIDIPIRYRARNYGSTNISRFRDGVRLLRMSYLGLVYLRLGKNPRTTQPHDLNSTTVSSRAASLPCDQGTRRP
jgi:hypothetical protein